jgi:hypothetical protein
MLVRLLMIREWGVNTRLSYYLVVLKRSKVGGF